MELAPSVNFYQKCTGHMRCGLTHSCLFEKSAKEFQRYEEALGSPGSQICSHSYR